MLKWLGNMVTQMLSLTRDTRENKEEIRTLRQQVELLTDAVQQLAFELRRVSENEVHEREKMALRLENALLRFERRLPPARREPDPDQDES